MKSSLFRGLRLFAKAVAFAILPWVCEAGPPYGTNVGPIQFDAIVSLAPPLAGTHMLFFARYWVASDYYAMAVAWAEPMGPGLRFPVYPVSLRVESDRNSFELRHDIFGVYNTNFCKPVEPSGTFRFMYGDYPITNLRFADRDFSSERLYRDINGSTTEESKLATSTNILDKGKAVYSEADGSFELLGEENQLLERIHYEHEGQGTNARLSNATVFVPERQILVGLRGEGVLVKSDQGATRYRDFPITFEKGGRKYRVEYKAVVLGDTQVNLPVFVEVKDASDGSTLRSVRLFNFQPTKMGRDEARSAATEFGGLTPELREEDRLTRKYQAGLVKVADPGDLASMRRLRKHFTQNDENSSIGSRLRRLAALTQLNDMLEDEGEIERLFHSYLALLKENELRDMALSGGAEAIEREASMGRFALADRLLAYWSDAVEPNLDGDTALRFARFAVRNSEDWEALKLLEHVGSANTLLFHGSRFELEAWKSIASTRLLSLFEPTTRPKADAKATKSPWVRHVTSADDLKEVRDKSMAMANVLYREGGDFTKLQTDLHFQLSHLPMP